MFSFMQGYVMRNITHLNNTRSLNLDPVNISYQAYTMKEKLYVSITFQNTA